MAAERRLRIRRRRPGDGRRQGVRPRPRAVARVAGNPARAAGVAWCAGFGRLGGIVGPVIGGLLIGAGFANNVNFYIFAGIALAGGLVTWFVPRPVQSVPPVRGADRPVPTTVDV